MQGDHTRAVQIFAASEAIRSSIGTSLPPLDMALDMANFTHNPEQAQEALNESDYQVASAKGSKLTLEQAIELALQKDR